MCKMHVRSNRKALINSSQTASSGLGRLLLGPVGGPRCQGKDWHSPEGQQYGTCSKQTKGLKQRVSTVAHRTQMDCNARSPDKIH